MNEQLYIIVIAVLIVLVIISIIIGLVNNSKINTVLDYSEEGDLVENLQKYYNNILELQKKLKTSQPGAMSERIESCEKKNNMSLSKIGIENFDAFDDVKGKQSFALAVLNQYNDGFIITSLYGSASSNTYVRSIKEGKAEIKLLDEEQSALTKAMSGNIS